LEITLVKQTMSHRERLETCLSGQMPDHTPVALWRHFPGDDQQPGELAASCVAFQRQYDFDLVKVTPASSFAIKDWGAQDQWIGNTEGTREYTGFPIRVAEDWEHLRPLDPARGALADQLTCLKMVTDELAGSTPVLQTIFSPLAQAKNLVGRDHLIIHIRENPSAVHAGLEVITQSTLRFLEKAMQANIDGIFYAVQHAQYGLLTETEFDQFGRAYDLRILQAASRLWLNMVHLHGEHVMFNKVADYPAAIINWHDRKTKPNLAEAQRIFPGVVCGGLQQWETMVSGTPQQVRAEALDAVQATAGKRFILGTGCVLPIIAPRSNIQAAIDAALGSKIRE
jgi:uroporphyrinogen decarboxylase